MDGPNEDLTAAGVEPRAERASPASAVCYLDDQASNPRRDTDYGHCPLEREGDGTPRSEMPAPLDTAAPAVPQHLHDAHAPSGFFSPQPVRPYPSKLPTADPSPTPSLNSSTTSLSFVDSHSQPPPTPERPSVQRDLSSTSTASVATVRASSVDPLHAYTPPKQRDGPHYPNQSYAALQFQHHPTYASHAHPLRTRSSHPAHFSTQSVSYISTFSNPGEFHRDIMESGSRTVGNSPASSPGLFSPVTPPSGHAHIPDDNNYSTLWLHPSERNMPRETSVAELDIDPVSGRKIINQYEILSELGRGVHGKVKRGRDLITHREVAIKIVERYPKRRRLGKSDKSFQEKIKREIAILKKARHQHIVGLLEVIDDPASKKIYIILELVELGEVKWRTDATKEVGLVEWRRYQRECKGIFDDDDEAMEDEKIIKLAHRKLERQRRRRAREMQRLRRNTTENEAWSFETGGDSDSDDGFSNSGQRSRSSTTASTSYRSSTPVPSNRPGEANTFTGLEGTMYGAYDSPLYRDRTPSIAGSSSSRATESSEGEIPEEFRHVPTLTIQAAREVFRDATLGLEYLHYQGIVHRDIKPANLLQTLDHRIKISDFGVSYLGRKKTEVGHDEGSESECAEEDYDDAIELAKTVGTPAFFAPELCRTEVDADTPPVDFKIDIWALGVTLYCLVYGRIPFFSEHNNIFDVMKLISETEPYLPKYRLKAVIDQSDSRPSSHGRMYHSVPSSKRAPHDLEYEEVDDDLRDLLKRLLVKDPRHRISIVDIKRHPWLLRGIENSISWVEATDPTAQGRKIQVSKDDVEKAVAPITVIDRIRSGLRKTYDAVVRVGTRGGSRRRAQSTATGQDPPSLSANSSSSTISQEGRRPSLVMSQHIFEALGRSRDADRPLAQSVSATPEARERSRFFDNAGSRTASPAQNSESREHLSPLSVSTRPLAPERAHSAVSSSAASVRTIRQSDMPRPGAPMSPIIPPALPGTPTALESPGGPNLSGILGGVPNRFIQSMRSRDRMLRPARGPDRAKSSERPAGDDTAHSEPSVALSTTSAVGHVPDLLLEMTLPGPSAGHPTDPIDRASSRQSSVSSASSRPYKTWSTDDFESTASMNINTATPPPLARVTSDERFSRAKDEFIRRRVLEENQGRDRPSSWLFPRPPSALSQMECPPSPDDEVFAQRPRTGDYIDQHVPPSLNTSPVSYSVEMAQTQPMGLTASSSEDHFTTMSQSTSNPSIPSAVSTNSSTVAAEECVRMNNSIGLPSASSADSIFLNHYDSALEDPAGYDGDNPLESDDDQDDDSSEEEDFIVMGKKKPAAALVRSGSMSNAEPSRSNMMKEVMAHRRRSTRSGSNGTVKKIKAATQSDNEKTPSPM